MFNDTEFLAATQGILATNGEAASLARVLDRSMPPDVLPFCYDFDWNADKAPFWSKVRRFDLTPEKVAAQPSLGPHLRDDDRLTEFGGDRRTDEEYFAVPRESDIRVSTPSAAEMRRQMSLLRIEGRKAVRLSLKDKPRGASSATVYFHVMTTGVPVLNGMKEAELVALWHFAAAVTGVIKPKTREGAGDARS